MPRLLLLLALGALPMAVATPTVAVAAGKRAGKTANKAARYAKKGKKAYKKKRWDDAIVAFELAHRADPQPKFLFNIGRCWEKKGDLFKAMEFMQRYVSDVEEQGEKEDAQEVYAILRGKLLKTSGEVTIDSEPQGAAVRLVGEDNREVAGATPMTRWLPAGRWKLQVARKGLEIHEAELFVAVGETSERFVELQEIRKASSQVAAAPSTGEAPPSRRTPRATPPAYSGGPGWPAWTALGAGAVLLAGGAVLGLLGRAEADKVQAAKDAAGSSNKADAQAAADSADQFALGANVLLGVGGAAVAAGAVLWLTADSAVRLLPGGLVWQGRW